MRECKTRWLSQTPTFLGPQTKFQYRAWDDSSDSEEESSGPSRSRDSGKPSTSTKTASSSRGHDDPDGKGQSKTPAGASGPRTSSTEAGVRRTKDSVPPSDRVLRSSSRANASQNQAATKPTQPLQPRAGVGPAHGPPADSRSRGPTIESTSQRQSQDRFDPRSSAGGSRVPNTSLTQVRSSSPQS